MVIKDVISILEALSPLAYAEDFDNVGLLVGDKNTEVSGILVTLDTLENVIDEAIAIKANLIISFHPIIFSGLKKITGNNYVERVVIKAIQNNIAIFSMHTALDNSFKGVNDGICSVLGLQNRKILIPQKGSLKKLTTYVPSNAADTLRIALCKEGAGAIGNYSDCSFTFSGTGSYKGNENSTPVLGKKGEIHFEKEVCLNLTYQKHLEQNILNSLVKNHPYEEVAYEISTLENKNKEIGMGMLGELTTEMDEQDFLVLLKEKMNVSALRHSSLLGSKIKKVAVLGGSGAFAIKNAIAAKADIYITSDLKYHDFFSAENKIILADIGHYESEQFTKNLLVEYLTKKIPNFAISLSKSNTNPIKYF